MISCMSEEVKEQVVEEEKQGNSGRIFGIVCIAGALVLLGYLFKDRIFKKTIPLANPVSNT